MPKILRPHNKNGSIFQSHFHMQVLRKPIITNPTTLIDTAALQRMPSPLMIQGEPKKSPLESVKTQVFSPHNQNTSIFQGAVSIFFITIPRTQYIELERTPINTFPKNPVHKKSNT